MATLQMARRKPIASMRHDPSSEWRHIDMGLVGALGAICLLGLLMVYSSTRGQSPPYDLSFASKQLMFMVIGCGVAAAAAFIDYRVLLDRAALIYGTTMFLLVAVRLVGQRNKGTQGWFALGPFQLQPSEFAKLALIMAFGFLAAQFNGDIDERRLFSLLLLSGAPIVLVLLQPDLGTALVSVAITFCMLVVAGVRGRYLALMALGAVLLATLVLNSGMLGQYQRDRLTVFATQESSKADDLSKKAAYNLQQSKIAIGSGGLDGKGLFKGPQTQGNVVPEQHTDFIFTAVGEELGMKGAGFLLALYAFVIWRVWRIAQLARDEAGMLLCIGVLAMFAFQIFQNIGMTMGIMPITGIPLPFMSYGGSSTIMAFAAVGLVVNVGMRRFR